MNERSESTSENVLELLELYGSCDFCTRQPPNAQTEAGRRPPPVVVKRVAKLGRVL